MRAFRIGEDGECGAVNISGDLESLRKAAGCEYIDIVRRRVGLDARPYTIVVDDKGFACQRGITARDHAGIPALCGDLVIFSPIDCGEGLSGLGDKDIDYLHRSVDRPFVPEGSICLLRGRRTYDG